MAIQEKIQRKSEGFGKLAPAFLEGAKFALENQWTSVEEDLPCNHEELIDKNFKANFQRTFFVIALNKNHCEDLVCMINDNGRWKWLGKDTYTHWMVIPKLSNE